MSLPTTQVVWGDLVVGHGTSWRLLPGDGLRGWLDTPDADHNTTGHPGGWGDLDVPVTPRGRTVTVSGWVHSTSRDALVAEIRAATTMLEARDLVVTVAGQTAQARARLVRRTVDPDPSWGTGRFLWSLTFRCSGSEILGPETIHPLTFPTPVPGSGLQYPLAYPLDFGDAGSGSSSVFVANPGTVPLFLRLRVDGPVTNPRMFVSETGSELRLAQTVAAGQWLDVLTRDRRVLANGVASRRYAATYSGDWLAIPPGGATVGWDADDNDPDARLWVWAPEGAWI